MSISVLYMRKPILGEVKQLAWVTYVRVPLQTQVTWGPKPNCLPRGGPDLGETYLGEISMFLCHSHLLKRFTLLVSVLSLCCGVLFFVYVIHVRFPPLSPDLFSPRDETGFKSNRPKSWLK